MGPHLFSYKDLNPAAIAYLLYLTCQQALQEASRERTRERSRQDRSRKESFCRGADSRLPQMESLLAGYFLLFYL